MLQLWHCMILNILFLYYSCAHKITKETLYPSWMKDERHTYHCVLLVCIAINVNIALNAFDALISQTVETVAISLLMVVELHIDQFYIIVITTTVNEPQKKMYVLERKQNSWRLINIALELAIEILSTTVFRNNSPITWLFFFKVALLS